MNATRLEGPQIEPVPLGEMRDWLRVETHEDDEIISTLIVAARERVEMQTGEKIMRQSWRLVLDRSQGRTIWPAAVKPVVAILAVRFVSADGARTNAPPDGVMLRASAHRSDLAQRPGLEIPPETMALECDVVAGLAETAQAAPEPLKQAIRLLVAGWYAHRGDETAGGDAPHSVAALIAPCRRMRLA